MARMAGNKRAMLPAPLAAVREGASHRLEKGSVTPSPDKKDSIPMSKPHHPNRNSNSQRQATKLDGSVVLSL